ncbi:hypothetical protein PWG15_07125 [Ensifer adhaerens]|uniref:hypothetical protein n=1 Tax=Ensifer adhaerens TaxID=106592 RepID=UPI0023A9BA77|nr:hypothetical protein [Ensifer adhaerens]WDZ78255.1 hypothetical protein PWG15_07125 [Ensifer adhaerens]
MPETTKRRLDKLQELGERLLDGGRLHKTLIAIGAASIGPGALYGVIHALITGEVSRRGAVILTANENPFEFYTLMLVGSVGATLGTLMAAALLVVVLKRRASSSRN